MKKDYLFLALGNLRHRGLRSWLTILGIFIGIAAVVALISMGQGLETAITGQFGTLSVDTLTIQNKGIGFGPPGSTVIEKLNEKDIKIIKSVNGVSLVIPRLIRVNGLEYNEVLGFVYSADIPEKKESMEFIYENAGFKIEEGRLIEEGDVEKVLLGNDFLTTGDFGKEFRVGKNIKLNGKNFEIIGILKKSSSFQMNSVVFMATSDMQNLLNTNGEYDLILAQIKNPDKIEFVAEEIENKLREDRKENFGEETFTVETPLQSLESVQTILNIINLIVIGIAAISLFVGGIGIANTMYTSVLERTKEIGIMKAIGAKNKDILYIFLIESGLLGLVGGIAGSLFGLGIAFGVSSIANSILGNNLFAITLSYPLIFGAITFSFGVGVLSGIFPAIQGSKLNVVEALRK